MSHSGPYRHEVPKSQMDLPNPIQSFIHPTPRGEGGQSAALAAGTAHDGVAQSPPATLDSTTPLLPPHDSAGCTGASPSAPCRKFCPFVHKVPSYTPQPSSQPQSQP
eukprot:scaffold124337_cov30-Tisochrysis_lutea.AAC.4